jgi:hypothetical protein
VPTLTEGKLAFNYPDTWNVTKYDQWPFYRNQFASSCGGNRAVDFLAYDPESHTLWLIEVKDYRQYRRTKDEAIPLVDEVAAKARDTLAGIFAAKLDEAYVEHHHAARALGARKLRVVLHLEQPPTYSKLFPRAYEPSDVQQKLRQMVKPIDAHPRVIELNNMAGVRWSTASIP